MEVDRTGVGLSGWEGLGEDAQKAGGWGRSAIPEERGWGQTDGAEERALVWWMKGSPHIPALEKEQEKERS